MSTFFLIVCLFFWLLLGYYSILTVAGILYRVEKRSSPTLPSYPSVSIFIPAYNEGIVLASTLDAMIKLEYPGELTVYVLNDNSQDNSAEIAQFYADLFPRIRHILVPPGTPKGKWICKNNQ
ncbi:MAG: family 2 glycosyl transferase [Anaerospora sp.]|nr:family 2 glycosyl transferase [Anaerospora sp.]